MKKLYLIAIIIIVLIIVICGSSFTFNITSKMRGDINLNGFLDENDLELLTLEAVPLSDQLIVNNIDICVKDLNSDGKVDMIDSVIFEMVLRPECNLNLGTCANPVYVSPKECKVVEK